VRDCKVTGLPGNREPGQAAGQGVAVEGEALGGFGQAQGGEAGDQRRTTALTAGGPAAIARIQRLLTSPPRHGLPTRTFRLAAGLAALTIPAAIACLPLAIAACAIIATA
jgi:hypothetical protein